MISGNLLTGFNPGDKKVSLDMRKYKPGIYLLKVISANEILKVIKVVKEQE